MALALESSSAVQRKVKGYSTGAATGVPVSNGVFMSASFDAFFSWWAANKGNADLQIVRFTGAGALGASGEDEGIDAAHRVYAFYAHKTATDEDVYLYIFDDATNDAGAGTDGRANLVLLESANEAMAFYPNGIPMVDGLVIKAYTDFDGTTDSTAGVVGNGFVIIGAP